MFIKEVNNPTLCISKTLSAIVVTATFITRHFHYSLVSKGLVALFVHVISILFCTGGLLGTSYR